MKNQSLYKIAWQPVLLVFFLFVFGCNQDPVLWRVATDQQVISDFIASNPNDYSEFNDLLESVNLKRLLSVRGPYTLFLPNDEAMKAYYKEKGVSSFTDFTDKEKKELVYNHLVANEILAGDILLGALRDTNAIGDFLVTEFSGSDIIINKRSKIINRDIRCANGIVHEIDKVIVPVKTNIYDVIASNPSFSLFAKGLEMTGLKDTLQTISFPFGKRVARNRYTVLAVPDTIFNRFGIHTIDDLISFFTDRPDSITFLSNDFYRYMEYHCMGGTYYLSALETRLYPILSYDNNISVTIDTDYKLNLSKTTGEYTGFIVESSNVPAKNGALHVINGLLPVIQPDPTNIVFETTDYFDMRQGDYFGKYYMKWFDGQNTFAKIKWEGDYLQYYYKNHDTGELLNWDCLNMNGFFWCEITTPKIMKGKYKITSNLWSNQIDYEVYVDGKKSATINRAAPAKTTSWGEFEWNKTEEHKIKVVNTTWGLLFWDTVIFSPLN